MAWFRYFINTSIKNLTSDPQTAHNKNMSLIRQKRLDGIRAAHGEPPRGSRGELPIPLDEIMKSFDGSAMYLDNQWCLFL